jgi:tungstate transport system permease protein
MGTLYEALVRAARLIVSLDPDVLQYALRSLYIALVSTALAGLLAVPLGIFIAEREFRGKRLVVTGLNTLLAVPTVVVGLFVYALVSRQGPFGFLGLLFTVPGIVIGEVVLIAPLLTALTLAAVARVDRDVRLTARSLGASERQAAWVVIREARYGILAAIIAAYGRVVGEVGVAMIVGGNIDGFTRTLTTAIILNADMGYFALALALGLVLLAFSFVLNVAFQLLQGEARMR